MADRLGSSLVSPPLDCDGQAHRLAWAPYVGLRAVEHDVEHEQIVHVLGGRVVPCLARVAAWGRCDAEWAIACMGLGSSEWAAGLRRAQHEVARIQSYGPLSGVFAELHERAVRRAADQVLLMELGPEILDKLALHWLQVLAEGWPHIARPDRGRVRRSVLAVLSRIFAPHPVRLTLRAPGSRSSIVVHDAGVEAKIGLDWLLHEDFQRRLGHLRSHQRGLSDAKAALVP